MIKKQVSHTFALYSDNLLETIFKQGDTLLIHEENLIHRLSNILRVRAGQRIIIFDTIKHATLQIEQIRKQAIEAVILDVHATKPQTPSIHWLLPLLERDAFEESWYALTVLGATSIQPIVTTKTRRTALSTKEHERLQRIMITAAEQSKQFAFPLIKPLKTLQEALGAHGNKPIVKAFFDPLGKTLQNLVMQIHAKQDSDVLCLIGPEGDLTTEEKESLNHHDFSFYALTQSTLRSEHALWVSMGSLRSLTGPFAQTP